MDDSDPVTDEELPLAARKKKKRRRGAKMTPKKRIRKNRIRNLPAEKPIECPDCGLKFYWMSTLKVHQRQHTGEKPYKCKVCKKTFAKPYSLKTHLYIHSDEKPYKCNFCPYACRDSSTLRKHHYRHMGIVQTYNCKMCTKSFSRKYCLKNHVAEVHLNVNLRTHECEQCGKLFKSQKQVSMHAKFVHERARATTCPICNKYLSNTSNLKTHLVSHIDERPYMCDFPGCNKRYKDKSTLQKHTKLHRPDKQLPCTECGYQTTRPARLRYHMVKVHQRSKSVECNHCGQRFYSKNYLTIHLQKHDVGRKQYICDMCGFKSNNKPGMAVHMRYKHDTAGGNAVRCNLCRKTYRRQDYLKIHYKKTHNIAYKTFRNQREKTEIKGEVRIKTELQDSEDETLNDLQMKIVKPADQMRKKRRIQTRNQTRKQEQIELHRAKDPMDKYLLIKLQKLPDRTGKHEQIENDKTNDETGQEDKSNDETGKEDKSNDETGKEDKSNDETGKEDKSNDETGKEDKSNDETGKENKPTDETGKVDKSNDETGKEVQEKEETQIETHKVADLTGKTSSCKKKATPSQPSTRPLHKCEVCGRFFKKLPRLKNHMIKVHGRSKCVACEHCGLKFYSKNYLIDHMYKRHVKNEEYVCDECGFKTRHKPGIACHMKYAHVQAAVKCDICKKKYKRLDLLQYHYSEAHNISYKINTSQKHQLVKDVIVKIEPTAAEQDAIDLLDVEKHEVIEDRSLTTDGTTTLKGLIERSGVRMVPERVFEEFCSGHIRYLPAGISKERGKPQENVFGLTDKKLEAQANNKIHKLASEARRKRAREKLEQARQMYNQRMKAILEAKSKTSKIKLSNRNEESKEKSDHNAENVNEENKKASKNNSDDNMSDDEQVTSIVDNSDVSDKSDGENTQDNNYFTLDNDDIQENLNSEVESVSEIEDETSSQSTHDVVNSKVDKKESFLTLLEELQQLTTETQSVKEIYLEGEETTMEDVLTGDSADNDSNDTFDTEKNCKEANVTVEVRKDESENKDILKDESAENYSNDENSTLENDSKLSEFSQKANDLKETASINKDNNDDHVDIESDTKEITNKASENDEKIIINTEKTIKNPDFEQNLANESSKTDQNQIKSQDNASPSSNSTFTEVLLNDHYYAKSETTREIELKLLQCPETLFDKSYDTSEEDRQNNIVNRSHDVTINNNVTLLDTDKQNSKSRRKQKLKLIKDLTPPPKTETQKTARGNRKKIKSKFTHKKRYNNGKKDVVYENFDSATPLVFEIPKKAGQRVRKQKLENRDCYAEEDLPLIFMTRNSNNDGNENKPQQKDKDLANKEKENANDQFGNNISVKEENDETKKNMSNKRSSLSFKFRVLVEQLLESFNKNEEVKDEDLSDEMIFEHMENHINADFITLLKQTKPELQNDNQTDNENSLQDNILTDKLKEIVAVTPKPSDCNGIVAKVLKSIEELISENPSPNITDVNSEDNASNLENDNSLPQEETSKANESNKNNKTPRVKILSNTLIVANDNKIPTTEISIVSSKRKRTKNRKYFDDIDEIANQIPSCNKQTSSQNTENIHDDNTYAKDISRAEKQLICKRKSRKRKSTDQNTLSCKKQNKSQSAEKIKLNDDSTKGEEKQVIGRRKNKKRKLTEGNAKSNSINESSTISDQKSQEDVTVKKRKRKLNKKYSEDSNDDKNSESTSNSNKCERDSNNVSKKSSGKIIFNTHQCYVCFKVFETKDALVDHCKAHFGIDRKKSLKKCPLCEFTCTKGLSRHMKEVHDVSIKIPYARIQEELDGDRLKYYFEVNDPNIKRIEVMPSVKNLNRRAMLEIDKERREKDAKVIAKHKLVKKGNEWIVEKEEINLDNVVIPEFDKDIDISDKIGDADDYFDSLKKLFHVSKKAGKKMMFPCQHCDKICQNLAALKLHNRKHVENPPPFAPKVWKHKMANPQCYKIRKDPKSEKIKKVDSKKTKKKKGLNAKLATVNKNNLEDVLDGKDNRKAKPQPIKNNHNCDPELQAFYRNNIRGGDIEFWQFLKIFNKMDRDDINDFKDLKGKYEYGIDTELQNDILEKRSFILQVGSSGEDNAAENENTSESNNFDDEIIAETSIIDKEHANIVQNNTIEEIDESQNVGNNKNDMCTLKANPDVTAGIKIIENRKITLKNCVKDKMKRAHEIAKEIMEHSLPPTHHE